MRWDLLLDILRKMPNSKTIVPIAITKKIRLLSIPYKREFYGNIRYVNVAK